MSNKQLFLVYDTQCPVCHNYCTMLRIRESVGQLQLVDAREGGELVDQITARGWDIDQGMVLQLDQELYFGADAIHALSMLSSRSGTFNRINYWIFRSPMLAKLLYPILKLCRNVLLKNLGRSKINNLGLEDNDHF